MTFMRDILPLLLDSLMTFGAGYSIEKACVRRGGGKAPLASSGEHVAVSYPNPNSRCNFHAWFCGLLSFASIIPLFSRDIWADVLVGMTEDE